MFVGYLALGGETYEDPRFELVNNGRALAYVEGWNAKIKTAAMDPDNPAPTACIDWLTGCDDCFTADELFTDGDGYAFPETDPAPWYDPDIRDSEKFLGVIGLEVTGVEDSTQRATVVSSIAGGGVVGRLIFGPRTMVVRALAVAVDDCGMEVGLNWLRSQYATQTDDCTGDHLWFLDCCPDCTPDPGAPPVGPCWAETFEEITDGPASCPDGTWWPSTFGELRDGPPPEADEWCAWITNFRELEHGLPEFSCGVFDCLTPYLRSFQNVRVTEGPIIVNRQSMHRLGEIAEIEFTIVAADPDEYTVIEPMEMMMMEGGGEFIDDEEVPPTLSAAGRRKEERADPFARPAPRVLRRTRVVDTPTQWVRESVEITPSRIAKTLRSMVPRYALTGRGRDLGAVRVGLWRDGELVDGFLIPKLPGDGSVSVDGRARHAYTEWNGKYTARDGFAAAFDGGVRKWATLPVGGTYVLTVDQEADKAGPLEAEFGIAETKRAS